MNKGPHLLDLDKITDKSIITRAINSYTRAPLPLRAINPPTTADIVSQKINYGLNSDVSHVCPDRNVRHTDHIPESHRDGPGRVPCCDAGVSG